MEVKPASAVGPAVFSGRRVLVCVTGGIAAYKACVVVSRLAQAGALTTVAMTESATRFVTPLTFQALSAAPVYGLWSPGPAAHALASRADAVVVAPCTMDCLARLATGGLTTL